MECPTYTDKLWIGLFFIQAAMQIGQKVKVRRLRDRLPANVVNQLKKNPIGTIDGFKMVDGSGVGVVVKLDNNLTTWFFEDELEPLG